MTTADFRRSDLLARTLKRRWVPLATQWAILTVALMCTTWVVIKPVYRASIILRVDPSKSNSYGPMQAETLDTFLASQVEMIKHDLVLKIASKEKKLIALPRFRGVADIPGELRKAIQVNNIPGTYLIEVASTSTSPIEPATVVNYVVDAFMEYSSEVDDQVDRQMKQRFKAYYGDLKDKPIN